VDSRELRGFTALSYLSLGRCSYLTDVEVGELTRTALTTLELSTAAPA